MKKLAVINLITLIIVIGMNALANYLPLNNNTTGELSEQVNVLFTPGGYVFSIWSVIYSLLAIWAVRAVFTKHRGDREAVRAIGLLFVLSSVWNTAWLFAFHYEWFAVSMIPMGALFITLIMIYAAIRRAGKVSVWTKLPFSIYMGWISVAFIVNIGILFNSIGLEDGFLLSNVAWTVVIIAAGALIAAGVMQFLRDAVYPAVFVWAYLGIFVERADAYPAIAWTALAGALFITAAIGVFLMKKRRILEMNG
ncbi:tryptophan-rich sensory protein [Alkalicoccus luteus]|uniref:Tryptophan-rich sensory protein n=1 Tax=Alkalicoccus luteus TaxID=1237094 RepID=A0A969PUQ2_9BACI|nr:tryptophan-rich sensory protein [Alkalicoccus luteus]NJP38746.1 tryptophan-rich sensory protein [Alkalicoccus luteus]